MDKDFIELLKTDGLWVASALFLGYGMQLFTIQEYIYCIVFLILGTAVAVLRSLRKNEFHKKTKKK